MNAELERVADDIFSQERTVSNVKFFRGVNRSVTAAQLCVQLESASLQIRDGRARLIADIDAEVDA